MTATARIGREGTLRVSEGLAQEIGIASHCAGCAARCSGSAASVRLLLGDDGVAIRALDGLSGSLLDGQRVQVSVSSAGLTRAAMVLFGLPVAFLLSGALMGEYLAGDAGSVVMGYSFLFVVMGLLLRFAPFLVGWTRLRIVPSGGLG
jgi:positive regulator of sigma E activity